MRDQIFNPKLQKKIRSEKKPSKHGDSMAIKISFNLSFNLSKLITAFMLPKISDSIDYFTFLLAK